MVGSVPEQWPRGPGERAALPPGSPDPDIWLQVPQRAGSVSWECNGRPMWRAGWELLSLERFTPGTRAVLLPSSGPLGLFECL